MNHFYALIMAGGGGTRLWPLSRRNRPKQILPLTEERTMIQITVDRLKGLLPPENIYIVASQILSDAMREYLPELPARNFIVEPSARNSGPAAGLGSFLIAQDDPDAVIAVLSADHHIANEAAFRESLRCAETFARKGEIVTLGITPSFPSTSFGYIQRKDAIGQAAGFTAYRSGGFREKPDAATAADFVLSGMYSWNAGMFIWHVNTIKAEFERQQPVMAQNLHTMVAGTGNHDELWKACANLSIDYAIMEHAQNIAVIPVDIGWSDVGTWSTLYEVLDKNPDGNAIRSNNPHHIQIDTRNTMVLSERMVVTIGVDDLVIVDADNVLLVCHRDRSGEVKLIVEELKSKGRHELT